jgi:hypothetical protein
MLSPAWISRPDEVNAKVAEWAEAYPQTLLAESRTQFAGYPVWALTVTDRSIDDTTKRKAIVFKPHAHEPAPIAAQMDVINQLLTGETLDGQPTALDRERILRECLLVFMPDANPEGTARAPVEAWDGSQYTNEEFWAWMRGPDPNTGLMWKRVDIYDDREEETLPTRRGIVYEQIDEHHFVEPNRHHASSLFQWLFGLLKRHDGVEMLLDLHQTEFEKSPYNAMVILPCLYDTQPPRIQQYEREWAEAIVAGWAELDGVEPMLEIKPLGYTGQQRQYFVERWGEIYGRYNKLTTEIQNNNPRTPPALQQRMNEVAIGVSIQRLLRD